MLRIACGYEPRRVLFCQRNRGYLFFSVKDRNSSQNNPCFPCKIAITNFLVSNTCKIRFHDVIYRTVCTEHGQMSMFWTLIFQFSSLDSVM